MRRCHRALPVLVLGLSLAAAGRARAQGAVYVKPALARIEIPLGRTTEGPWRWNDPATRDLQVEYRWVAALAGDTAHAIGFMLYKHTGAEPHQGPFHELLHAGQANLVAVTGHRERVVRGVRLTVFGADSLLVVELRDPAVIAAVFAGRPRQATLETLSPYQPFRRRTVPVQYDGF